MKSPVQKSHAPLFSRSILSTVIALAAMNTHAQDATPQLEEVLVVGQFQRNLENALNIKRNASTIVDGISADDIGTLPALDMGEALQAIPGVQLNREGERRESSVNLRGLPSGFVLTTAAGQTFATTSRSTAAFGAPNPLGAYDPSVFNGIDVVKTQTADMQEGGIAGTVNQKLAKALDKKNGASISIGGRREALPASIDGEIAASGSIHIIEDVLAVTGTIAHSEQNFRRDTIKINRYDNLPTNANLVNADGTPIDYAAWAAANNLPAGAVVKMPGELRQSIEISSGTRTSFSGGVEFQATDELKLGLNTVYTARDLDKGGQQELDVRPRQSGVKITPLSAPFNTGVVDSNGNPIYSVSDIATKNSSVTNTSRFYDTLEQSQAIILDAEWTNEDWTVDGAATFSSSTNELNQIIIAPRNDSNTSGGDNGVTGILRTGQGNIGNFQSLVEDNLNLNLPYNVRNGVGSTGSTTQSGNGRAFTLLIGEWEKVDRDVTSFEANAFKVIDQGPIESIKFGMRISEETQDSRRLRNSPAGINVNGIITNESRIAPAYVSEAQFFGGNAPGFTRFDSSNPGSSWYALDVERLAPLLANTIPENFGLDKDGNVLEGAEAPVRVPFSNWIARGGQQGEGLNYDTTLNTSAIYAMANFAAGDVVSGNVGLRYVSSSQEASAPFFDRSLGDDFDINNPSTFTVKNDYAYFLPSLNIAVDLTDDVIFRMAYGKSMSRPNMRAATPASSREDTISGDGSLEEIEIELPGSGVDPFTANSYDMSLEWYNRSGSAITFALFRKDVNNFFQEEGICDNATLNQYGINAIQRGDSCLLASDETVEINASQLRNTDAKISVQGYELSIQQNLNFLPYPWDGFGGVFNYSNTSQDAPLEAKIPGISDDTFNIIGYYEQDLFGIRFAYNYRSDYELESVGTFNGEGNKNVKAAGRIDMSIYVNVTEDLSVSLKGYNLTETLYEEYQDTKLQPRATHFDGRIFALNAKYTF